MKTFIETFNAQAIKPIEDKDLALLTKSSNNKTVKVANEFNKLLRMATECDDKGIVPAKFSSRNSDEVLEVLAVPESTTTANLQSLKIVCAVRDLKAIDEPKFFVLTQYELTTAKTEDVIAGICLSLVSGPLSHMNYVKLKIEIFKQFLKALNSSLTTR